MSDYTPSMDELRGAWVARSTYIDVSLAYDEFDRAIAVHDVGVRRAALLEAAKIAEREAHWTLIADALREEAGR